MHIGLIVGIGPAATDFYYRYLIAAAARAGHDLEATMAHADTPTLLRHQAGGDSAAQVAIYRRLGERLKAAGAKTMAVTSIAGHFCIGPFKAVAPLPVLDLLEVVARDVAAQGLGRVGLIGTRVVMQSGFYGALGKVEVVAPPGPMLDAVHDSYVAMAASWRVSEAQRAVFFEAGRSLARQHGCQTVMLAGTDLGLAFDGQEPGFPVLDCARLHADAIAAAALSDG